MKPIFFLLFLILPFFTFGQGLVDMDSQKHFPESWKGKWQGNLEIFSPKGVAQTIPMEVYIYDHDSLGRWNWQITYKGEKEDVRAYELVVIDSAKGHYQIDEKNSILLDSYMFGNTLSSRFSVDGSLLIVNYSLDEKKEELTFELFWGKMDAPIETGKEVKENVIHSYPVNTRHRAILRNIL